MERRWVVHPRVRTGAWLAAWLGVAVLGVVMVTQALGWTGTRTVVVLQSLTPYMVALLAPLAGIAAWRQQHRLAFTAGAVGVGGLLLAVPLVFAPDQAEPRAGATGIDVAAVNLLYSNERIEAVGDVLVDHDADLVVFTEYTAEHQAALLAHALADRYPHKIDRDGFGAGGMAIWSRYPAVEGDRLPTTTYSIDAGVEGPDGSVRVVGLHPPTPILDFDLWADDLRLIRDEAAAAVQPTLLIGDFNASYWNPNFRDVLRSGFVDAHMAHGRGFSVSWPTDVWYPPFVRLDHALTGGGLVSTGVYDFDVPGSDHRGFVVTVAPAR